ncbi:FadR family transcriptional regulator [Neisseria sp. ZJ106]|uniref:Pyruvate dehydrogenase complex repressor n=1 Tax=Neisseria lisongii TaxID=2912188 RepID=A0AAW5AQ33_9NEIS|nr:FadR/GntR family transcriptional regulator [Neisseria lisongii]MCF7521784.1 FadR family transcriptional regulator [Neisseria lisongii]MCF7530405.1 FadR family transcriptional regulator [Neisseria lisongii]WCL70979.1 FadR/GntR family transcriptional regulator [Neisseria lisongii]
MSKLVRPQKISDQILAVLEERIASGEYAEGGKIPPERTLAAEFEVSRPSVRAALNILVSKNILEARQGDGYYVSVKPQQDFLQSWQEILGKHPNWEHDVYDFSCHIEGCMASLAAQRHTDADLKRITFWLEKFEAACAEGNLEHQIEADSSFHHAIADAAHNLLFSHLSGSLLKMLYQQTRSTIIRTHYSDDPRPTLIDHHRTLFEAIKARRPEQAARIAREHLNFVSQSVRDAADYQTRREHADTLAQLDLDKVKNW